MVINVPEWAEIGKFIEYRMYDKNHGKMRWFRAEIPDPYGDVWNHPVLEMRSRDWHIGRILYFIKHPNEIRDIEIDNECNNGYILPQPVIVDGWHRYAAARWLFDQEKLFKIHCRYGGRMDVLDYLQGNNESLLHEVI